MAFSQMLEILKEKEKEEEELKIKYLSLVY